MDLVGLFRPITKWASTLTLPESAAEMVRKAFKQARSERPGASLPAASLSTICANRVSSASPPAAAATKAQCTSAKCAPAWGKYRSP